MPIMRMFWPVLALLTSWTSIADAMEACTRHTPIGVGCFCNRGVYRGRQLPGWVPAGGMFKHHYMRPGWHVTNARGMHDSGNTCFRDQ